MANQQKTNKQKDILLLHIKLSIFPQLTREGNRFQTKNVIQMKTKRFCTILNHSYLVSVERLAIQVWHSVLHQAEF